MIGRYSLPEMAELWTDEAKYATWVQVELLACEAQAERGVLPPADLQSIRRGAVPTPEQVREQELTRDHEVLAFLAAYTESIPSDARRWVHHGMTSYDLVDTALGHTLSRACELLLTQVRRLRSVLVERALQHWDTPCVARTHGVHAEPTTFGHKLAGFAFSVDRSIRRLRVAGEAVAVGTLSGAVGTYSWIDPLVEHYVCDKLGLGIEPIPTQVVGRDRHAELLSAVAVLGAVVEQVGLELRLLQRTEVREVEEPRTSGYQGSSAMPHKRNPTSSERICGLARLLRANAGAVLEDVALWHERDLAHSSVERITLPDSLIAAHYQVSSTADLIAGLTVFPERMRANLELTNGLIHSSAVLSDLVEAGADREAAYRGVQAAAAETWRDGEPFEHTLRRHGIESDRFAASSGIPVPGRSAVPEQSPAPDQVSESRKFLRQRLERLIDVED